MTTFSEVVALGSWAFNRAILAFRARRRRISFRRSLQLTKSFSIQGWGNGNTVCINRTRKRQCGA